jgi:hypothetical protein
MYVLDIAVRMRVCVCAAQLKSMVESAKLILSIAYSLSV